MRAEGILLLALVLSGCASPEVFPEGREYVVRYETNFFVNGPAQPGRPEKIPVETFLAVLKRDSGYSYVKLEDGRTGYIASEDIASAPPTARGVPFDRPKPERIIEVPLPDFREKPDEIPDGLVEARAGS